MNVVSTVRNKRCMSARVMRVVEKVFNISCRVRQRERQLRGQAQEQLNKQRLRCVLQLLCLHFCAELILMR